MENDPFEGLSEVDAPFIEAELAKYGEFQEKRRLIASGQIEVVESSAYRCPLVKEYGQ